MKAVVNETPVNKTKYPCLKISDAKNRADGFKLVALFLSEELAIVLADDGAKPSGVYNVGDKLSEKSLNSFVTFDGEITLSNKGVYKRGKVD